VDTYHTAVSVTIFTGPHPPTLYQASDIKIYISSYTSHRKHCQWSTTTGHIKPQFTESQFHGIYM